MDNPAFHRNELLMGRDGVDALAQTRVILFGVGGVGSWCAEALVRSGVGHLTLVDGDVVCETNMNRQLQATVPNLGRPKVEALKERLLEIAPHTEINALQKTYNLESKMGFGLAAYDYVIDAIDTLSHKVSLIALAMESGTMLFSSMGAARKLDATAIRVSSIWDTKTCKLARFVRRRLRRWGAQGDCLCVYSEELSEAPETGVNGSMVHVTGTFGFHLAGLVVQDVYRGCTIKTLDK